MNVDEEYKVMLRLAVAIFRQLPLTGESGLSMRDAMIMAGVNSKVADTEQFKRLMQQVLKGNPQIELPSDEKAKAERAVWIFRVSKVGADGKKKTLANCMRLVGYTAEETAPGGSKLYMRCSRMAKNMDKAEQAELEAQAARAALTSTMEGSNQRSNQNTQPGGTGNTLPLAPVETIDLISFDNSEISPVSCAVGSLASIDEHSSFGATTSTTLVIPQPANERVTGQSVSNLTTSKSSRKSSKEAHAVRQEEKHLDNIHKSAFKVGTILYHSVQLGENNLIKFSSADKVAIETNKLFGIELVSGYQLKEGVKNGRTGLSPPRRGPVSQIPEDEFKALTSLVFTAESIEQATCAEDRLERPELITRLGMIVNSCLKERGEDPLNEVKLFQRVEKANSHLQNVCKADPREINRVKWLTYRTQIQNHERFEDACVELGFARLPVDEQEREHEGHVVFFKGQLARILGFDEFNLSFDGSERGKGGRPAFTHTNPNIPEAGKPTPKSGKSMSIMAGITFEGEPLPPYLMIKSDAELPRFSKMFLATLPQIEATYGYPERRHFNIPFTANKKGGMNSEAFKLWYTHVLKTYFPDAADEPRKRVLDKSDSGPGRFGVQFNAQARVDGFYHFPSTPNGTEVGQEMDQLFAYLKSLIYKNMDKIEKGRWEVEGSSAQLSMEDIVCALFGLDVTVKNGKTIKLVNAFAVALSRERIMAAIDKCGYAPATRNSLNSEKLRHEVVLDEYGEVVQEADPLGKLLLELQQDNHNAVELLLNRGYAPELVKNLKRSVIQVTANQINGQEAILTIPNTRERQDQLMEVSTAGQHFAVTKGGAPTNSTDMLLAMERKEMHKKAEKLEKKKSLYSAFAAIAARGQDIANSNKPPQTWNGKELAAAIRWRQGLTMPADEKLSGMKVTALKVLWETKYCNIDPPVVEWTDEMEFELQHLLAGEISLLADTEIIRAAIKTENDFLRIKLQTVSQSRQIDVIKGFLNSLPPEQLEVVSREILACNPDEHIPEDSFSDADDLQGKNLQESQDESLSTGREDKLDSHEVANEAECTIRANMGDSDSLVPTTQLPRNIVSTEDNIVIKIGALEKKLAEILEFKRKLEVATNRMSEGNYSEEDLMVLIHSRGATPVGTRARQLAKQWKSAQRKPEVWKDEWNATKQELEEFRNQLE